MRILFLGTSSFAIPTLLALSHSQEITLAGVVTQPDRPRGRGRQTGYSPVKECALQLDVPIYQPEKVRDKVFIQTVREIAPDALVLASFGQIIPRKLLEIPPLGPINVHASLLPQWRGAAPIQYALLNGDMITGVTTMWMEPSLDTGDILLQKSLPIEREDNTETLTTKLADLGAPLLLETLTLLGRGNCPRIPQNHDSATYAPSLQPDQALLQWDDTAEKCCNLIRAMYSKPGAYSSYAGKRVKLLTAHISDSSNVNPGTILKIGHDSIMVACSDKALELSEVQPENGKRMGAAEWARGVRIKTGEKFDLEPPPV